MKTNTKSNLSKKSNLRKIKNYTFLFKNLKFDVLDRLLITRYNARYNGELLEKSSEKLKVKLRMTLEAIIWVNCFL